MSTLLETSQLKSHLGFWLRYVSNHVSQAFARKLEGRDVTVAEWVLLRALYDSGAISPSRLADQMGLTRGAITKLADRLIAKGLVVRVANPEDGRAQTLTIGAAGRVLVPDLSALADCNDAEFFGHLTPETQGVLMQTLKDIVERHRLTAIPVT